MSGYSIATSGIGAAQAALDVIGNNIANAATEGYHRQRVDLAPAAVQSGALVSGSGVEVLGVTQLIDELLEREILAQESLYAYISQELSILTSVESMLGEFSEGTGLNETIDTFFQSLEDLASNPSDTVSRNAVVNTAQALASEFRRLGQSLGDLKDQAVLQAETTVDNINAMMAEIATMNQKIHTAEVSGSKVENLRDHRDQLISELAGMVEIGVQPRDFGVVDVYIGGFAVVAGSVSEEISLDLRDDQTYTISLTGSQASGVGINGGTLGGLLSITNDLLAGVQSDLDTVAKEIIAAVNQVHVQGLGTDGSFSELTGWALNNDLAQSDGPITDGTFYIRVIDTSTGEITRHAIDVDVSGASPDTLTSIAAKITAIDGLTAAVESARLHITADQDYTFDFIQAVLPEPTSRNLTAASPPTVEMSGIYTGAENDTFTFTVTESGSVGNDTLRIEVTNTAGDVVRTFGVGGGYAAGDTFELPNGIKIAFSVGDLNSGDSFEVDVFASTDTSGFLAAAGINTFFTGTSAEDMYLSDEIANDPNRIATASGSNLTDNTIILALAGIQDQGMDNLNGRTINAYYQGTVTDLGQQIALKQSREDNIEAMLQNLETQRGEVSGVDINEEAAAMLIYQQMFQAMSQYMGVVRESMVTLMNIL